MTKERHDSKTAHEVGQEIGRYTPRPNEQRVSPNPLDFERWQDQLNQNFNQLTQQLEKMHLDLAQALNANMASIKASQIEEHENKE